MEFNIWNLDLLKNYSHIPTRIQFANNNFREICWPFPKKKHFCFVLRRTLFLFTKHMVALRRAVKIENSQNLLSVVVYNAEETKFWCSPAVLVKNNFLFFCSSFYFKTQTLGDNFVCLYDVAADIFITKAFWNWKMNDKCDVSLTLLSHD